MQARMRIGICAVGLLCAVATSAPAQDAISLLEKGGETFGWTFDNGREFPGAVGKLSVDKADGACLRLDGDFSKGGNYVQAGRKIDNVDIRELSMWIRSPDADRLSLRINDASGQTHQIVIQTEAGGAWQHVVLPLERFFARRGEADAVLDS